LAGTKPALTQPADCLKILDTPIRQKEPALFGKPQKDFGAKKFPKNAGGSWRFGKNPLLPTPGVLSRPGRRGQVNRCHRSQCRTQAVIQKSETDGLLQVLQRPVPSMTINFKLPQYSRRIGSLKHILAPVYRYRQAGATL